MNQLSILTLTELAELSALVCRGTAQLYRAAETLYHEMSQVSIQAAGYTEMDARATLLMAAAAEQAELLAEIEIVLGRRRDEYRRECLADIARHSRQADANILALGGA